MTPTPIQVFQAVGTIIAECDDLRAENAYFRRSLAHADDVVIAERANMIGLKGLLECAQADLAHAAEYAKKGDELILEERTANIRLTAQLEGFKAENAKLDIAVAELREALAAASASYAATAAGATIRELSDRLSTEAAFRRELTRKLNDREQALAASRGRAAELQRRVNTAAGHLDNIRLVLVDSITE
jgi:hypothetical protein